MKCMWGNTCDNKYLCCHYCDKKDCATRCKDLDGKEKKCKYFINEKYEFATKTQSKKKTKKETETVETKPVEVPKTKSKRTKNN